MKLRERREKRQAEAKLRQEVRDKRSDEEQIKILRRRGRGNSKKEIARLKARIAERSSK